MSASGYPDKGGMVGAPLGAGASPAYAQQQIPGQPYYEQRPTTAMVVPAPQQPAYVQYPPQQQQQQQMIPGETYAVQGPDGQMVVGVANAQGLLVMQAPQGGAYVTGPSTWRTGICGCCSNWAPTCLSAWCCSCCLTARLYDQFVKRGTYWGICLILIALYIVEYGFSQGASNVGKKYVVTVLSSRPEPELFQTYKLYSGISTGCGILLVVLGVYFVMAARQAMRQRYRIPGDDCNDCCCSFWCHCCVLAQMFRQVKDTRTCCDGCALNDLGPALVTTV